MTPDPSDPNVSADFVAIPNSSRAQSPGSGAVFTRTILPLIVISLFSLTGAYACYRAAGSTLGLFFGGFIISTVLAPVAVLSQSRHVPRLIAIFCTTAPIAAIWLIPVFTTPDTPIQWIQLSIALFACSCAVAAIALCLARLGFPAPIAAAFAILFALAWLTWPIWLSATLASAGADRFTSMLVSVHPPLTANGVLLNEPAWSERALAYQLTNLNQDIPMELPHDALPCVLFHFLVAGVLYTLATFENHPRAKLD